MAWTECAVIAGPVNAAISEERGSLTTEESIKIPLEALADHSLSVRKTALQDIRNILHQHRSWLGGLLPANSPADGTTGNGQHAVLLSSLLGALLKCCDPEVIFRISISTRKWPATLHAGHSTIHP